MASPLRCVTFNVNACLSAELGYRVAGMAGHFIQSLPVMLDVGTENETYLRDPLYLGVRRPRVRGQAYDDFVDEFITAVHEVWPKCLIQFEDFANINAFRLLERYRTKVCTFNDDIQGTASVTLAGILSALRFTGKRLSEQRILFLGAGEAGIGIGDLIANAMTEDGLSLEEARQRCSFVDSKGLVVKSRTDLASHKLHYAHDVPGCPDLLSAIHALKPTALIGVSTISKAFNREVVEAMGRYNERPIVFALSNPTSKAECSAEEAYGWTQGRAIYASGSPFPPVTYGGRVFIPGQGNNAYIFPGVGLGVVACEVRQVSNRMFSAAARALAEQVLGSDLEIGRVYPSLKRIQEVSANIAAAVAAVAYEEGTAGVPRPGDLLAHVRSRMWKPEYRTYV